MKLPASMLTLNYIDLNWPQKQFSTNKQSYKWMYLSEIEYFKQAVNKGFLTFKVFKSFEKYFEASLGSDSEPQRSVWLEYPE